MSKSQRVNRLRCKEQTLESLTDIFSFFTPFDSSVSRQTCKWWNSLLTKDEMTVSQVTKNTYSGTSYDSCLHRFSRLDESAVLGYLDLIKFVLANGYEEKDPWTYSRAAQKGHFKILKWARANGYRIPQLSDFAAKEGNMKIMKWARANGSPWYSHTCKFAAGGGHLEILKLLKDSGLPLKSEFCHCAANGGHVEVLKWLLDNGCPHDIWTCAGAAGGGHIEVLKWARAYGCAWNSETCRWSESQGRPHIQAYIHGLPLEESPCSCPRRVLV